MEYISLCLSHAWSKPESTSVLKKWDESAADMTSHDSVRITHQFASNEHHRYRPNEPNQSPFHLSARSAGVLVQLVNRRVDTHVAKQLLHGVTHGTCAYAEYHHRVRCRQPPYPFHYCWVISSTTPSCGKIWTPRFGLVSHWCELTKNEWGPGICVKSDDYRLSCFVRGWVTSEGWGYVVFIGVTKCWDSQVLKKIIC